MSTVVVDLKAEAATEVGRLVGTRRWVVEGDDKTLLQLEAGGCWIATARRAGVRRALGPRVLCIWRVACDDGDGGHAVVESCLVAVVVECSTAACTRRPDGWINTLIGTLEPEMRARVEAAAVGWQRSVEDIAASFASRRISRQRAIAASALAVKGAMKACQPGLFDRRALRPLEDRTVLEADVDRTTADRLAATTRSAVPRPRPAELLLVFGP